MFMLIKRDSDRQSRQWYIDQHQGYWFSTADDCHQAYALAVHLSETKAKRAQYVARMTVQQLLQQRKEELNEGELELLNHVIELLTPYSGNENCENDYHNLVML